jgi:hypothetical protein
MPGYAYSPIMHGLAANSIAPTGVEQSDHRYEALFEQEIRHLLHTEAASSGAHLRWDGDIRVLFEIKAELFADEIRLRAARGSTSWRQAHWEAAAVRSEVMRALRIPSTPLGRTISRALEAQGMTLNEIVGKKTLEMFGKTARFDWLSPQQRDKLYGAIVEESAKSGVKINQTVGRIRNAGRVLVMLAMSMSVYNIATKDDMDATVEQSKHGSKAGGAKDGDGGGSDEIAGIKVKPGTPICVGIGQFVEGALNRFGVTNLW